MSFLLVKLVIFFFLFYNFNEETPIKIEIWISKCLVNDDILIINKCLGLKIFLLGAGKSSFFNSVESVFKQRVSRRANAGTAVESLTTQVRNVTDTPMTRCTRCKWTKSRKSKPKSY